MKNKDNEIEQMLLSNTSLDDLIKRKIEQDFVTEIRQAQEYRKPKRVKNIALVPKELIFSPKAVFKVFNRNSKTETKINGIQADALIGLQNNIREKVGSGQMSTFVTNDAYVKFDYAEFCE